ncbi:putative F-box/FBD/LRR-repeat protein At5g44950 [Raphanus sativus]|uniref:F-box/FBD/LRR-repeat protein At5g44950 n=1 Tax=Raphanus sativus TaxID=3726 RepID=A0A9W3C502_RAPSA|nr:putative F-box/FBD/LRR-repeat protein At5g44950 [Raphanus sativus]
MAEPFVLFLSCLLKMQQDSSLVQNRFNDTLRHAMRTRINDIFQRRVTPRTDAIRLQKILPEYINYLEFQLMNSANSEEEYSNPRDLEVRLHCLDKEFRERLSRLRAMRFSHGLSALPDTLITQILLYLPTKDSIKTSFISKRFRDLWLQVPGLDLCSSDLPAIKNFINRFLVVNPKSRLQKFKIKYDDWNTVYPFISELIVEVLKRGVDQLDIGTLERPLTKDLMHFQICKGKTLVSLKLANLGIVPNPPEFVVSLPCLKTMHLEDITTTDPLIIEKLISGCPVLEDLTVSRVFDDNNVPVLRVRSLSLKRFWVKFGRQRRVFGKEYAVEIDAPGLKYMNFRDDHSDRVVVKNLSSLFVIDIDTQFSLVLGSSTSTLQMKKAIISDFLKGISCVRHMIISQPTLEVLNFWMKQGQFTKFSNLSRLEASFCTILLQTLPHFLEGCPKLKHLTLYLLYLKDLEPENLELTVVPQCLLCTLECVEVKEVTTVEKAGKKRARYIKRTKVSKHKKKIWIEVVRYILENSLVLKKLVLCFSPVTNSVLDISEALPTFTIRSPGCQIFNHLTSL